MEEMDLGELGFQGFIWNEDLLGIWFADFFKPRRSFIISSESPRMVSSWRFLEFAI
jgi:hypothetical protein